MERLSIFFAALMASCMLSFAGTFVKTDLANIKSTDVVIITAKTSDGKVFALSNDKGASNAPTAVAVTVDKDNKIETEATNILWNLSYNATDATFKVNVAGGTTYLYCTDTNNGVRVGTGKDTLFSIKDDYIYHEAYKRYLGVYNQNNWRCYANTTGNIANQTCAFYVQGAAADIPATAIALDKETLSLDKGATEQLTATLTPADATTEVVWTTDNAEVATVANGLVTAVGVGFAKITATAGSVSAICAVTVNDVAVVAVENVALNQTTLTIEEKKTATLVATITPDNATNKNVTWKSDAEAVASVENGVVTGIAEGTANITVTTEDGNKTATCVVTVTPAPTPQPFSLYSGTLVEGDYIIYFDGKAMNNEVSSNRLQCKEVTPIGNTITTDDETIIWHIAQSGEYWTIYNKESAKYAASTGTKNQAQLLTSGADDMALWTITESNGTYEFVNKANEAKKINCNLRKNGTYGFACYATGTGGPLSLYKKNVAGEIAKPAFTPTESDFIGSVEVSITAEEGLDIYYTLDGTEPTTASIKYTAPFTLTATTTVKAIAYNATTSKASEVAEKTYTAQKLMTCAEANAAAKGDNIILGTVTVVYVNGANIYVADATGTTLVFAYDFGLVAGQVVKGLVGTMDIYNGLPEVKPSVTLKDLTISEGTIPEPTTVTTAPVAADVNKYLTIEGVRFDKDYKAFKTRDNANVIVGETALVVRNNFTIDFGDIMQAYAYDITGFVSVYNGKVQFYPILIEDITAHGVYTVGVAAEGEEPADFESLAEAFTAYNETAAAGMVAGDVTLQIISDLNEPKNVGIQNPTEYTLTLTVDKAEARTISFSQAADNAGPSGNICIGCDMTLTHTSASVESKNIVIDGSFNGSEESYLTIKSVAGCQYWNAPILIYGNVKDITVKNCALVAENGVNGKSIYPVTIRSQKGTDFAPENITIDNNYIEAVQGNSDQGIYFQLTTSGKKKPANVTISNNTIKATTRGILMKGINNATIKGNVIMVNQLNAGMDSHGIYAWQDTEGEFIIEGNNIAQLSTNAAATGSGISGIVTNAGKWYIRNNYVAGFNVANAAADNITLVGIQGSSNADTVVIEHNTVVMPEQANKVANASAAKVCLIKPVTAKVSVKNNLLVSNENGFANALVASPAGIMESNVYCTASYVGATEETKDFAAYQTAVEPTAKSVVSVTFEDLATGILDLVAPSDGDANLGVTRLADVTTDIYGTERGEFTYAGAYQGTAIQPGPGSDVENINANGAEVQKIVRDGQVLIIRDGKTYNVTGQVVE